MGIYIKVKHPSTLLSGKNYSESRVIICKKAVKYFNKAGFFYPSIIEIWSGFPSEFLGGKIDKTYKTDNIDDVDEVLIKQFSMDEFNYKWYNSIIRIQGLWVINNEYYKGYFSINNSNLWRKTYYDISIDAFGPSNKSGLIELLLEEKDFNYIIGDFFKYISIDKIGNIGNVSIIIASHGAPQSGDVKDLVAIHVPSWRSMIKYFYDAMNNEEEEYFEDHIKHIDKDFFTSSLTSDEGIYGLYTSFSKDAHIIEMEGGSVSYIGLNDDSFQNLYDIFKKEIFKKAAEKLPNKEEVKNQIFEGIGRYRLKGKQQKIEDLISD